MKKDELQFGDRIEVYRNLHKDCFSIRKNGRVVRYLYNNEKLHLHDVKFAAQPAGRAKVLREGRKNVHAFVRGLYSGMRSIWAWQSVASYNPYKYGHFFTSFGGNASPIHKAKRATLSEGKVYVNP
jgi:hypothetical protein